MAWAYNTHDGTPNTGPALSAIALTFTSLALITVCLRLYVRGFLIKAVGKDDWVIIVAWLGLCGYTACTVLQTKWGLGLQKLDDMPPENVYNFGLVQYIGAPLYVVGIWGFKMSLLFSYLRFFPKEYRLAAIIIAVIITLAHIAFICVFLFLCTPIQKSWDPTITTGHCANGVPFYLTFSSLTIVFDVLVLFLPFPVLLKSKIQTRKKAVLLGLFALGLFVTVIQIIRIQTIKSLTNYLDSSKSIIWSIVENAIGIIITCIPTLSPLVKYFSGTVRGNTSGSRQPDSRYGLQTWKSGKSGMHALGSGVDNEHRRQKHDDDSTENILSTSGITKTTDVVISRDDVGPLEHTHAF